MRDLRNQVNGLSRATGIKAIQSGTVTLGLGSASATATITAVDPNNALIFCAGYTLSDTTDSSSAMGGNNLAHAQLTLTNATTVTAFKQGTGGTGSLLMNFVVLEFYPGIIKSVQRGTITISGASASNTATITSVNTSKSVVFMLGVQTALAISTDIVGQIFTDLTLTNATTVTATRSASGTFSTQITFQVVEWF